MRRCALLLVAVALCPATAVPADAQTIPDDAVFGGSSRGSTFYWVGCRSFQSLNPNNWIFFESREDAIQQGYRQSRVPECAGPLEEPTEADGPSVTVRVIDTGPGLCTITTAPSSTGPLHMVYDAGHFNGNRCRDAVMETVETRGVELMIISHSDGDHFGNGEEILDAVEVRNVIGTGDHRTGSTSNLDSMVAAIGREPGITDRNLANQPLTPGETIQLGEATITLLHGLSAWTATNLDPAEGHNAISIVAKLEYQGGTVLFTGDVIGRRLEDNDPNACRDAEAQLVDRHNSDPALSLDSDVMFAPHHGANNGSSSCFLEAVSPEAVIFSAGHDHRHPTIGAVNRYVQAGVRVDQMFRTDVGDDEPAQDPTSNSFHPDKEHWEPGGPTGCRDRRGDEEIEITIDSAGDVTVRYVRADVDDLHELKKGGEGSERNSSHRHIPAVGGRPLRDHRPILDELTLPDVDMDPGAPSLKQRLLGRLTALEAASRLFGRW